MCITMAGVECVPIHSFILVYGIGLWTGMVCVISRPK